MYKMGEDQTIEVVVQTVSGELSDISIAVYVDLINEDELLGDKQKTEKIVELMGKNIIVSGASASTQTIMNDRIDEIKTELSKDGLSTERRIILQYSLVRLYRAEYLINVYLDDSVAAESYKTFYNAENAKLVQLYK